MNTRSRKNYVFNAGVTITQPSQAFTPRQILDQFARNEVVPSIYEPSDMLTDDNVSDDDMENIIEFEDKIDAEGHLKENQYQLFKEEKEVKNEADESKPTPAESNPQSSNKVDG